jgi:AcrR family transcriptional regulator
MEKKQRGRPRGFDPDQAIGRARDTFWRSGFAATSLDDLSTATGLGRPSLYAAFGDKQAMYIASMEHFRAQMRATYWKAMSAERPVRASLLQFYKDAIEIYCTGPDGARGCFVSCTAPSAAVDHADIRSSLKAMLDELDGGFVAAMRRAVETGGLPAGADPSALGRIAAATLHSIAIRARGGEDRAALTALALATLDVVLPDRNPD